MHRFVLLLLVLIEFCSIGQSQTTSCPFYPGWYAYKNEKCFRLVQTFATQDGAEEICGNFEDPIEKPTLATIKSREEQNFLTDFVFSELGTQSSVWIGAKKRVPQSNNTDFVWNDGFQVQFSNWGPDFPANEPGRNCVEMQSTSSLPTRAANGQWRDVSCQDGSWFVCQRLQLWTAPMMQKALMDMRDNPVPMGFLFTQLPGQASPQSLWPLVEWTDVTGEYAGQFFRAEGGDSAPFGQVQGHHSPRITRLTFHQEYDGVDEYVHDLPIVEGRNPLLTVGLYTTSTVDVREYLIVEASGGEVRPVNRAVRLWRRSN